MLYAAENLHALIYLRQVFLFGIICLFYRILQQVSIKNSTKFGKGLYEDQKPVFIEKSMEETLDY